MIPVDDFATPDRRGAFAKPVDFVVDQEDVQIKSPNRSNLKAEERIREERKAWYNEVIVLHILDADTQKPRDGCTWKLPRYRLSQEFLQGLVNRSPASSDKNGCEISYVQDSKGEIILPTQMKALCKRHPEKYYIVCKKASRVFDVKHNINYEGDMKFVLHDVPRRSRDEKHEVTSEDIRRWVVNNIVEEDPIIQRLKKKVESLKASIDRITVDIKDTPTRPIFKKNGTPIRGKKADTERDVIFRKLNSEKMEIRSKYEDAIDNFERMRNERLEKLGVEIYEAEEKAYDVSHRTAWMIEFTGVHKEYHEHLALSKADWNSCPLRVGYDPIQIAEKNAASLTDHVGGFVSETEGLVDMGGVSIQRLENGYGNYHRIAEDVLPRDCDEGVEYYHGCWKDGVMDGYGIIYTSSGVYSGVVRDGKPCGEGCMNYADGDRLTGNFRKRGSKTNPFTRGLPDGKASISFGDGSYYEGAMVDGEITGCGTYIDASGDCYEGEFLHGALKKGKITCKSGEVKEGAFKDGELNGFGKHKTRYGEFHGFFVEGLREGKGQEVFGNGSKFTGFHLNDQRAWYGSLCLQP